MTSDLYLHLHPQRPIADVLGGAAITPQQVANAVRLLGEGAVAWAIEEAANSLVRLRGEFQTVLDLPTPEIRLNLETLILDIMMSSISNTSEHLTLKLVPSMARQAARLEVPFSSIVKNMRANQIAWVNHFFVASASLVMPPETVQRLVSRGAGVVDELIEHFVLSYLDERQALMESQIARRRALVGKLVGDDVKYELLDLKQIKEDLGLDLLHYHIGIMISDINAKHSADLGKLQRHLQDAAVCDKALVVSSTQQVTWAWVSTASPPTPAQIKKLEGTLAQLNGARCSLGEPAKGAVGFRRTHLQAREVSRVATASSIKGTMHWADHALTILLSQDLEKAAWYVDSVLGPLAYVSDKAGSYRQTLAAYLQAGNSLLHGAELLGIHRNTLVYRLQQIEMLLDYPIKQRELEVRCALHLVAHFDTRVLKPEASALSSGE